VQLPELASFVERLRSALAGRPPVPVDRPEARRAAVALLVAEGADPAILFIKRQRRAGDPWSGQMALPGGFTAAGDLSLEATARRETAEETGIELGDAAALLGTLDDVSPRTPYLPPIVVRPFVFLLPDARPPAVGPEVEAAVWLPASQLFSPQYRRPFRLTLPGEVRELPSIVIGDYTIWGLTERVLNQLAELGAVGPGR
jgi:8-oxo-dGTP pyrophosphatase MutT (NUDIX family)